MGVQSPTDSRVTNESPTRGSSVPPTAKYQQGEKHPATGWLLEISINHPNALGGAVCYMFQGLRIPPIGVPETEKGALTSFFA